MGQRKIRLKENVADNISAIAWFIESKGMIATAEKFVEDVYDFLEKLADPKKSYPICQDPVRATLGYKCVPYKKKYTTVFIETDQEIFICEFISSKIIHW